MAWESVWTWTLHGWEFMAPVFLATAIVMYGAHRAAEMAPLVRPKPLRVPGEAPPPEPEEEVATITVKGAFVFIFAASLFLVLLFFFMRYLYYIILAMYCFGGTFGLFFLVSPYLDIIFEHRFNCAVKLPWIGVTPVVQIILLLVSVVTVVVWAIFRNFYWAWIGQDLIGLGQCVLIISAYQLPNIKVSSVLLILAFLYDIFWVFGSIYLTEITLFGKTITIFGGKSVMVKVAMNGLPMLFKIPPRGILGLGDVVLPGLLVSFALKFDHYKKGTRRGWKNGYFLSVTVAYALGLVCAYTAAKLMNFGQPALLYLVPLTLLSVIILALFRGEMMELWYGPSNDLYEMENSEVSRHLTEESASETDYVAQQDMPTERV